MQGEYKKNSSFEVLKGCGGNYVSSEVGEGGEKAVQPSNTESKNRFFFFFLHDSVRMWNQKTSAYSLQYSYIVCGCVSIRHIYAS